jgi:hypothetical protein
MDRVEELIGTENKALTYCNICTFVYRNNLRYFNGAKQRVEGMSKSSKKISKTSQANQTKE